jgi:archaellum component FlaC
MTEFQNDQTNGIVERFEKIEEQLKRIADRLERIADAVELLASAIQPQFKDRDATLNIQAVCCNQGI